MSAFIQYQKKVLLQQQHESIVHSNRKDGIIARSDSNNSQNKKSITTNSNSNNNNNKTKSRLIKNDRKTTGIYSGKVRNSKSSSSVATGTLESKFHQSTSSSNGGQIENSIPVLDLHGFRLEKALRAVTDFLEDNRRRPQSQDSTSTTNVKNKLNSEIDYLEEKQEQVNSEQRWHGYDDNETETDYIKKDSRTRQPYWDQQICKNRHNPSYSYHYHRKQQQQQQRSTSSIRYCWCRIVTGTGSHSGMMGGPILRTAIESLLKRRVMQYSIEKPGCFLVNANSGIQFTTIKATGADTKLQIIDNSNNNNTTTNSGTGHLPSFAAAAAKAVASSSTVGFNKSTTIATKKNLNNTKTPIKYKKKNCIVYDDDYMDHIATLKIRSLKDIQYEEELTRKEEEEFDAICRLSIVEDAKTKMQQDQEYKLFQQALQVSTEEVAAVVEINDEETNNDYDDEEEELRKAIEESMRVQQHEELLLREEETEEELMIRRAIEESERLILEQQVHQEQVRECEDDEEELLIKEAIRLSQLDQTNDVIIVDSCSKDFHQSNAGVSMTTQNEEMDNVARDDVITSIDGDIDKVIDQLTNDFDDCDESVGQSEYDSSSNNNYNELESSYPILINNNMAVATTTAPAVAVATKIDDSCCPSTTATYDDESFSESKNNIDEYDDDDNEHDYCCVVADDEKYNYNYDNYIHENKHRKVRSVDGFGGSAKYDVDGDISNNSDSCNATVYYYDDVQEKIIQDILQMMNNIQHQST